MVNFTFVFFSVMQFDGEPGEMAKDACAEFCNHQKFALEQLKVSEGSAIWIMISVVFNNKKASTMLYSVTLYTTDEVTRAGEKMFTILPSF